jgi:hypothetical protein
MAFRGWMAFGKQELDVRPRSRNLTRRKSLPFFE